MKLKKIEIGNSTLDLIIAYRHNEAIIGHINVHRNIYQEFIKILTIYPLENNELVKFLKLDMNQRVGYMSRYMIKIAKGLGVPRVYVKSYLDAKNDYKLLKNTDVANSKSIVHRLYMETLHMCKSIFELYDRQVVIYLSKIEETEQKC